MADKHLLDQTLPDGSPAYFAMQKGYGEARGVSKQTVSKWKKAGQIVLVEDPATGKTVVDAAASDRARAEHQNALKTQAALPTDAGDEDDAPAARAEPVDPSRQASQKADAVMRTFKAKEARVRYERMVGNLLDKDKIERLWLQIGGRMVNAVMMAAIPAANRIAPDNPRKPREIIVEELRTALSRFADDLSAELIEEAAEEAAAFETGDA